MDILAAAAAATADSGPSGPSVKAPKGVDIPRPVVVSQILLKYR